MTEILGLSFISSAAARAGTEVNAPVKIPSMMVVGIESALPIPKIVPKISTSSAKAIRLSLMPSFLMVSKKPGPD